jgi:calcyclin binding protein
MSGFSSEIAEVEHLLSIATHAGVQAVLTAHKSKLQKAEADQQKREAAQAAAAQAPPSTSVPAPASSTSKILYTPIEDYAWDQGEYNSPTVSIFIDLDGVGAAKDRVDSSFTTNGFDLKITDLNGKNYRLLKDNLEKNIVPDKCKCVVKNNKIVLKLQKVKGEYSFEHWNSLTAKKKKDDAVAAGAKKDPMGGKCWMWLVKYVMFARTSLPVHS